MKKSLIILLLVAVIYIILSIFYIQQKHRSNSGENINVGNASAGFGANGKRIYKKYWRFRTCIGSIGFEQLHNNEYKGKIAWSGDGYMIPWWPIAWVDVVILNNKF